MLSHSPDLNHHESQEDSYLQRRKIAKEYFDAVRIVTPTQEDLENMFDTHYSNYDYPGTKEDFLKQIFDQVFRISESLEDLFIATALSSNRENMPAETALVFLEILLKCAEIKIAHSSNLKISKTILFENAEDHPGGISGEYFLCCVKNLFELRDLILAMETLVNICKNFNEKLLWLTADISNRFLSGFYSVEDVKHIVAYLENIQNDSPEKIEDTLQLFNLIVMNRDGSWGKKIFDLRTHQATEVAPKDMLALPKKEHKTSQLSPSQEKLATRFEKVISEIVPESEFDTLPLSQESLKEVEQIQEKGLAATSVEKIFSERLPGEHKDSVTKIAQTKPVAKLIESLEKVHADTQRMGIVSEAFEKGEVSMQQCWPTLIETVNTHPYILPELAEKCEVDLPISLDQDVEEMKDSVLEEIAKTSFLLACLLKDSAEEQSTVMRTIHSILKRQKEKNSSLTAKFKNVFVATASSAIGANFGDMTEKISEAALEVISDTAEIDKISDKLKAVPIDLEFVDQEDQKAVKKFFEAVCGDKPFYDVADIERVITVNSILSSANSFDEDISERLGLGSIDNTHPNKNSLSLLVGVIRLQIGSLQHIRNNHRVSQASVHLLTKEQESKLQAFAEKAITGAVGLAASTTLGPLAAGVGSLVGLGALMYRKKQEKK